MPPLLLDDEEAIAIAVGLRHRDARLGDGDRGDLAAGARQARAGPSAHLRRRVSALGAAREHVVAAGWADGRDRRT